MLLCCIKHVENRADANKNHHCVARDVGIREEICLIDANIGLVLPSHQQEKRENDTAWWVKGGLKTLLPQASSEKTR